MRARTAGIQAMHRQHTGSFPAAYCEPPFGATVGHLSFCSNTRFPSAGNNMFTWRYRCLALWPLPVTVLDPLAPPPPQSGSGLPAGCTMRHTTLLHSEAVSKTHATHVPLLSGTESITAYANRSSTDRSRRSACHSTAVGGWSPPWLCFRCRSLPARDVESTIGRDPFSTSMGAIRHEYSLTQLPTRIGLL